MDLSLAHSIWTVMMFLLFIGIVVWAWSGKRTQAFHDAAHLPLQDDEPHIAKTHLNQTESEEQTHG